MAEVRVHLDDPVWWRLCKLAEARGYRIADLLHDALISELEDSHLEELAAELLRAREDGFRAPVRRRSVPFDLEQWRREHTWGGYVWPLSPAEQAEQDRAAATTASAQRAQEAA